MRLDRAVAARGLARSRSHAQELIAAGRVSIDGRAVTRPATTVDDATTIDVAGEPWVGRAAHKLLGALDDLPVPVSGRALDVGASTGGFTQVLLTRGIDHVYALDVGHDQLAPLLRSDPRVTDLSGHNARDLDLADLGGRPVDLVVADVSFISLAMLLGPLGAVAAPGAHALVMVKPQFEVGRAHLDKHGVVRDPDTRERAVTRVAEAAEEHRWRVTGRSTSCLPGPAGNVEVFLRLNRRRDRP